jgi:hypothetical protein
MMKRSFFLSVFGYVVIALSFPRCGTLPVDDEFSFEAPKALKAKAKAEKVRAYPKRKVPKEAPKRSAVTKKGFKEVSSDIGLEGISAVRLYAVDWSGDKLTDLVILPDHYSSPLFYRYDPKSKKFIKDKRSFFSQSLRASFLVFADFNKDNHLDMIVATLNQKTELNKYPLRLFLSNQKGKKENYYQEKKDAFPPLKMPVASISLTDINMDGWLDLYVANWYDNSKGRLMLAPDRLFRGEKGGITFRDKSAYLEGEHDYNSDLKTFTNATPSFGSSVCDLDQNGFPDILVASSSGHNNRAWFNLANQKTVGPNKLRTLRDLGRKTGLSSDKEGFYSPLSGGNSFYMICSDYNQDGLIDVASGELFHSYDSETKDRSAILSSSTRDFPPQYIRTEYHKDDGSGSWSQGDRRAIWVDLNFDSYLDLVIENSGFPPKSRMVFFEQGADHSFADEAPDYGIDIVNPSGIVTMDFNHDGKVDLLSGQHKIRSSDLKTKLYAFANDFPDQQTRRIRLILRGKKANYHGLGASVFIKTNNKTYYQNVDYAQGALPSQNEEGLWFAIGLDEKPEFIEVRWPYLVQGRSSKYPLRIKYRFGLKALSKGTTTMTLFDNGKLLIKR